MIRQPFRLTPDQYERLTMPLDANRVGRNPKGFSHMEAWDVRRWLVRVFGFGSFDIETVELAVVREIEIPPSSQGGKSRWTVVYRAQVRLTVRDQHGGYVVLEDGACGDSTNQPALGDCHDNASKTALSQALKRCAVNLGDCFGLGLYNNGGTAAVVVRSLVAPELPAGEAPVAELPVDDAPVMPEPGTEQAAEEPAETARPVSAPPANRPVSGPPAAEPRPAPTANAVRDWALHSDRTADGIRQAAAKLLQDHPAVAAEVVVNETGDDEQLRLLLERRAKELTSAPAAPTEHDERRRKRMFALLTELGYAAREQYHQVITHVIKREVESSKDLSAGEVEDVIAALEQRKRQLARQAPAVAA